MTPQQRNDYSFLPEHPKPMTAAILTSTAGLELDRLESAAKAALRPETWAGTGIPSMSISPTTMIALISALRASEAEREQSRDNAAEFKANYQRWKARATTAEAKVKEQAETIGELVGALERITDEHYDEDGVLLLTTAGMIVGRDGREELQLKGSFISRLEQCRAALSRTRPSGGDADGEEGQ